jgi:hypothetical protein
MPVDNNEIFGEYVKEITESKLKDIRAIKGDRKFKGLSGAFMNNWGDEYGGGG